LRVAKVAAPPLLGYYSVLLFGASPENSAKDAFLALVVFGSGNWLGHIDIFIFYLYEFNRSLSAHGGIFRRLIFQEAFTCQ